jgi:hypothetical protein
MTSRSGSMWVLGGLALCASLQAGGLPPEKQAGSVSYMTGGVTRDEADAFKSVKGGYPLAIELIQNNGAHNEFTADAQVRVVDSAGSVVLDAKADGPYMLVRVPPGQYRVSATLNGRTVQAKPVQVANGKSAQATLTFPPKTD